MFASPAMRRLENTSRLLLKCHRLFTGLPVKGSEKRDAAYWLIITPNALILRGAGLTISKNSGEILRPLAAL